METLRTLIDWSAHNRPHNVYLIAPEPDLQLTFAQLHSDSRTLSNSFLGMGLKKGDSIALMLNNGYQTAKIFLGALYGGFTIVPLNVQAQSSHLSYILRQSDARIVFYSSQHQNKLEKILSENLIVFLLLSGAGRGA